jgi:hypothetical protein
MTDFVRVEAPVQESGPVAPESASSGAGQDQRPEWLPPKFNSPEDLAKAYSELERKLGQGGSQENQPSQETNQEDTKPSGDFLQSQQQATDQLADKGLDFSEFQREYMEQGGLSDDSYAKLEQAGFSRSFVESWIAGQEALVAQVRNDVFSTVGGEENYQHMVQWAVQSLSPQEIEAFNQAVESGSIAQAKMAVAGLFARFQDAAGSEPNLLVGDRASPSAGFRSQDEMIRAMRDPRYKTDAAYRADVERKVAAASFF